MRTSDLLAELGRMQPLNTGLLPRGCIAFSRSTDSRNQVHALYVIERPAGLVSIRYKKAGSQEEQKDDNIVSLTLSWPHTHLARPLDRTRHHRPLRVLHQGADTEP